VEWNVPSTRSLIVVGGTAGLGLAYTANSEPTVVLGASVAGVGAVTLLSHVLGAGSVGAVHGNPPRQFLFATAFAVLLLLYQFAVGTAPPYRTAPSLVAFVSLVGYGVFVLTDLVRGVYERRV
jgi:hypothetical protein